MLSPIITTNGKSNRACQVNIWSPTSYSGLSPVPLSPITAKCSVLGLFGSGTCACCDCGVSAAAAQTSAASAQAARAGKRGARRSAITIRLSLIDLLDCAFDEVGDQV